MYIQMYHFNGIWRFNAKKIKCIMTDSLINWNKIHTPPKENYYNMHHIIIDCNYSGSYKSYSRHRHHLYICFQRHDVLDWKYLIKFIVITNVIIMSNIISIFFVFISKNQNKFEGIQTKFVNFKVLNFISDLFFLLILTCMFIETFKIWGLTTGEVI